MNIKSLSDSTQRFLRRLVILWIALVLPACNIRFMAEHDQELQTKIIALQQKVQQLLIHLENTAGTPDAHYELFKNDYSQIHTDLQSIQAHAATFSQNQRTLKQLRLLDQSIEHLESIHREGIKHKDVVGVIDHQLRTAFTALLTLEQAKTRGQPSK